MNAYTRSTRECEFGELPPELVASIRKHANTYILGDIESSLLICCETTTTRQKAGLFANGGQTSVSGMFVTTQFLVWTKETERGKSNPSVMSALLRNIDAHDFENTAMYKVKPDSGMNITGRYTDVTKQGQTFIGLGSDPAGEKFRQVLQHSIQTAQL